MLWVHILALTGFFGQPTLKSHGKGTQTQKYEKKKKSLMTATIFIVL